MSRRHLALVGVWLMFAAAATAAELTPSTPAAHDLDGSAPSGHSAQEVAARIDERIAAVWEAQNVKPAAAAEDAEFLRRVSLDLLGRIPSVAEVRAFLKDSAVDKRAALIDRLLDSPGYGSHWSHVWRGLMMPEANANPQARGLQSGFEAWLQEQLAKNTGYDQMIRELLTTPIGRNARVAVNGAPGVRATPDVMAYYLAKDASPENLASGTARAFLGVRLECAQCHDHPFASWKREQFWGYAAFFASIQRQTQGDNTAPIGEVADRWELGIPGTDRVAPASFPDGTLPVRKFRVRGRQTLADWMTAPTNRYFARAAVNRMWFNFFGRGLVDPVDDMVGGDSNTHHPELLDELAQEFAAHQFDLKFLIRAITSSRAYQLSSSSAEGTAAEAGLFARMSLRGLTNEQLADSFSQATGLSLANGRTNEEFLSKFTTQSDRPTEYQTSILQALAMMNSPLVTEQTAVAKSGTLAGVLDAPFLDANAQIETLYLATLSRLPSDGEMQRSLKFVAQADSNGQSGARKEALADVFWALLNSSEFLLNH